MFSPDVPFLVVDDDPVVLVTTQKILNGAGYANVHAAKDGEEALAMLKAAQAANNVGLNMIAPAVWIPANRVIVNRDD